FKWKGVDTLTETLGYLGDFLFLFIGGAERKQTANALFLGHKAHKEIPLYLKAADVLVLPNPATLSSGAGKKEVKISKYYTSPLKLFEYMASQRPIVASDLPSIREILDEKSAVFFEPGDSEKLGQGIKKIINDENLAKSISVKALEKVREYTWEKRAKKILAFIG
ncbi:MAG: glycosyltransferase family 4 protein, partial [Candidatus Staskawiczbacteria bacterium]|nr:glycosyltransferase family 4 protein [Candidatus Staskawiczbacteria bacterium]